MSAGTEPQLDMGGPGSTGDPECVMQDPINLPFVDAFFIVNTQEGCKLPTLPEHAYSCDNLNFGSTPYAELSRSVQAETSYAMRPDVDKLPKGDSVQITDVELTFFLSGTIQDPMTLRVGAINDSDPWNPGVQNVGPPEGDESTFKYRDPAADKAWTGLHGPRTASEDLCSSTIPMDTYDHTPLTLCGEDKDALINTVQAWAIEGVQTNGLVVYTDLDGPKIYIKSMDELDPSLRPELKVSYCAYE